MGWLGKPIEFDGFIIRLVMNTNKKLLKHFYIITAIILASFIAVNLLITKVNQSSRSSTSPENKLSESGEQKKNISQFLTSYNGYNYYLTWEAYDIDPLTTSATDHRYSDNINEPIFLAKSKINDAKGVLQKTKLNMKLNFSDPEGSFRIKSILNDSGRVFLRSNIEGSGGIFDILIDLPTEKAIYSFEWIRELPDMYGCDSLPLNSKSQQVYAEICSYQDAGNQVLVLIDLATLEHNNVLFLGSIETVNCFGNAAQNTSYRYVDDETLEIGVCSSTDNNKINVDLSPTSKRLIKLRVE